MKQIPALSALPIFAAVLGILMGACGAPPGQHRAGSVEVAPNDVVEFDALYANNCAGCHGPNGRGGAAIALANPVYLAMADDVAIRGHIANGVSGTAMPAFARAAGGSLTMKQIDVLVSDMRSRWGHGIPDVHPPSYTTASTGDPERGAATYATYCESCHGRDGRGGSRASAITNDSFLALVSDQGLRSIVIAGRPELGAPDWRGNVPGTPMSEQEVTDVVAWLASHRVRTPGQPYAVSENQQR